MEAAKVLNNHQQAFGAGAICFDAIDAMARYEFGGRVGDRFKKWLSKLPDFRNLTWSQLERVYDDFRNGVTHEARIKNGGQFSYEIDRSVYFEDDIVVINPKLLLEQLEAEFVRQISEVKSNTEKMENLADSIRYDFREDVAKIQVMEERQKRVSSSVPR